MTRRRRQILRLRDRLLFRQVRPHRGEIALPDRELDRAVQRGRLRPGQLIPPRPVIAEPAQAQALQAMPGGDFRPTPPPGSVI